MKFYAILLDGTPKWCTPKINEVINKYNFKSMGHISAGCTTFTCFEMFTGCNPSNIVEGGIGYLSFGDGRALTGHADKELIDLYMKKSLEHFRPMKLIQHAPACGGP